MSVDGVIVEKGLIKTGSSSSKKKLKSVLYYDTVMEQCHHICNELAWLHREYTPDYWVFEGLSFGSLGNQEKSLASLFGAICERLFLCGVYPEQIVTFSPQTLKSYARNLLPEEEQFSIIAGKKKLTKMDKKMMIKAVDLSTPEDYLNGYKASGENSGIDDICDSWILLKLQEKVIKEKR